eukprot:NODE_1036_length_1607_cov_186.487805_g795_i2.p2 GENE.NODE_1036_length_1607_cov_186.487805_g795_i2~~NODE_1036_length_1607_cov_186.487805_g795_i2.p2  ORF type:complete len:459 (-),score=173.89 NODE_1036_length_1607_cov_186.487805_g795_i2:119-1495(-)
MHRAFAQGFRSGFRRPKFTATTFIGVSALAAGGGFIAANSSQDADIKWIQGSGLHSAIDIALSKVLNIKPSNAEDSLGDKILQGARYRSEQLRRAVQRIRAGKTLYPNNRALKHLDFDYFWTLSTEDQDALLQIIKSGVENPDSEMGCYAMKPTDYDRFKTFFRKVLADYHKVPEDAKHVTDWNLKGVPGLPENGKLDLAALDLPALSMRVRVGRNLADFSLPGSMTREDRENMEKKMCQAFDQLIADPAYGGRYYSLTPGHKDSIDDEKYKELVKSHLMFKSMADDSFLATAGISSDWPVGRGCYVSGDKGFIVWVGEEDHLRIMCMQKGTLLNDVFDRLKNALDTVEKIPGLKFAHSNEFGYVTSCPTNLGTGMRASVHIQLPNLTKDGTDTKCKDVCRPLGLSVRGLGGEHTPIGADGTVDISPSNRYIIKESEIITKLYQGLKQLKEREAAASN